MKLREWHTCRRWYRLRMRCPYENLEEDEQDDQDIEHQQWANDWWMEIPDFGFFFDRVAQRERDTIITPIRQPLKEVYPVPELVPEELPGVAAIMSDTVKVLDPKAIQNWPSYSDEGRLWEREWARQLVTQAQLATQTSPSTSPAEARAPATSAVPATSTQTAPASTYVRPPNPWDEQQPKLQSALAAASEEAGATSIARARSTSGQSTRGRNWRTGAGLGAAAGALSAAGALALGGSGRSGGRQSPAPRGGGSARPSYGLGGGGYHVPAWSFRGADFAP